jgi:hypothetical protein
MERFISKQGNPCVMLKNGVLLTIFKDKKFSRGYRFRAKVGNKLRWSFYSYKSPEEAEKAFFDSYSRTNQ